MRRFPRAVAWFLTHCFDSVTLAAIEREIINEIIARAQAADSGQASPAQESIQERIDEAKAHLYRTLEGWRCEYRQAKSPEQPAEHRGE